MVLLKNNFIFISKALILLATVAHHVGAEANLALEQFQYSVDEVTWGLTNANKTNTCVLLNGIFQVIISYDIGASLMRGLTLLTVPKNASVSGTCGELVQNITLEWEPRSGLNVDDPPSKSHRLTLNFEKKGQLVGDHSYIFGSSDPYYELVSVDGVFYAGEKEFPSFNRDKSEFLFIATNLRLMSAPADLSYFCQSTQVVDSEVGEESLVMSYVQAQAFHRGLSDTAPDGKDFGPRSYCPKDGYQMIFTVVAYVLILALVCVALFLFIRRRKSRVGYVYF